MFLLLEFTGCACVLFWLLVLATGAGMWSGWPPSAIAASESDRIAALFLMALGLSGIAVSVGMLICKAWGYRGFLASLVLIFSMAVLVFVGAGESWNKTLWACSFGLLTLLLRQLVATDRVRLHFQLPPKRRRLPVVTAWVHLALGLACMASLIWPSPVAMFGVWMPGWQVVIQIMGFSAGYFALAWGLFQNQRWVRSAALALATAWLISSVGLLWDPNPGGRLNPSEVMTPLAAGRCLVLGWGLNAWLLWRIWQHRRESQTMPNRAAGPLADPPEP